MHSAIDSNIVRLAQQKKGGLGFFGQQVHVPLFFKSGTW